MSAIKQGTYEFIPQDLTFKTGVKIVFVIALLVFCICRMNNKREYLTNKPTTEQTEDIYNEVVKNKEYFKENNYNTVKAKFDWIDPVLYEDVRILHLNGKLTKNNLVSTWS
jgi:hypothetical protein